MNNAPVRILLVNHIAQIGGGEVSLLYLVRAMDCGRYQFLVALPGPGPLADELEQCGVPWVQVPIQRLRKTINPPLIFSFGAHWVVASLWLARLARRARIAVIHANSIGAHLYAGPAGFLAGVPVVWHMRDILSLSQFNKALIRLCGAMATQVIAVSEAVRRHLLEAGLPAEQVVTIYDCVDLETFRPIPPDPALRTALGGTAQAPLVGIVGQLAPWKGQQTFIEAAALVLRHYPDARFLIVGEAMSGMESYAQHLRQDVKQMGLENQVRFLGFRQDIVDIMKTLDVVVNASWVESFGRTIIEAMALGKPVVATESGGPVEVVVDGVTGRLVPPRNAHALAETIGSLLASPALREAMGRAGRQRAEAMFGVDDFGTQIEAVYRQILQRGRQ